MPIIISFIETFYNDILSFQYNRDKLTQDGEWLLNGYNCTQSGPLTIEWSTTEDTTEYITTNQLTSSLQLMQIILKDFQVLI